MIDRAELWVLSRDIVWHNSVWIAYALSSTRELSRYPCSPVLHLNINSILKLWDDQNRTKFWSVLFTCACCTIVRMHSISEAWTYVPLPATLYPYMQATLYPYMLCTSLKQHNNTTKLVRGSGKLRICHAWLTYVLRTVYPYSTLTYKVLVWNNNNKIQNSSAATDLFPSTQRTLLVTPCTLTPMYLLVVGDTIKTACRNHKSAINFTQVHVDKVGSDNLWDRRLWWVHVQGSSVRHVLFRSYDEVFRSALCDLFF